MKSLLDWLDHRTGYRAVLHHLLEEPIPKGTGWAFTTGSALLFLLGTQYPHRRRADDVLRAGAANGLRQCALHHEHAADGMAAARPALLGLDVHRPGRRDPHAARVLLGIGTKHLAR